MSGQLNQIFFDYPISVPSYFALITRALIVLEGIAVTGMRTSTFSVRPTGELVENIWTVCCSCIACFSLSVSFDLSLDLFLSPNT